MRQVCRNPSCKSHGTSHPNCRCMGRMAEGGKVRAFCDSDNEHEKTCGYYKGGEVQDIDHSKFDLSKFKKADSNDTHTMFQHPDGHVIYVAHKAMSSDQVKDAKALPFAKLNKGGYVPPPKGPSLDKEKTAAFTESLKGAFGIKKFYEGTKEPLSEEDVVDVMQAAEANQGLRQATQTADMHIRASQRPMEIGNVPAELVPQEGGMAGLLQRGLSNDAPPKFAPTATGMPAQEPLVQPMPAPMPQSGIDMQVQGLTNQAKEESKLAREQATLATQRAKDLEKFQTNYSSTIETLEKERQALVDAVTNNKINPSSYFENQNTAGKVLTVIGIIAGGFGSKPNGENAAIKYLNDQIDRDIKAQQANLDKQNNLLKYNLDRTANAMDAMKLTKAQMQEIYVAKLEAAAAKSRDPMAQARLQQAVGALRAGQEAIMAPVVARMAMSKTPVSLESASELLNSPHISKEDRTEAVKELENIKYLKTGIDNVSQAYSKLFDQGIVGNLKARLGDWYPGGTEESRLIDQINLSIQDAVRSSKPPGSGPMSDDDAKQIIGSSLVTKNDMLNNKAIQDKMEGLVSRMSRGYERKGTLDKLGIRLDLPKPTVAPPLGSLASGAKLEQERRKSKK